MLTAAFKFVSSGRVVMTLTLAIALLCGTFWLVGDALAPGDPSPPEDQVLLVAAAEKTDDSAKSDATKNRPQEQESKLTYGPFTDAQRVARLQRNIESDRKQLSSLQTEGENPTSEFRAAEAEFKEVDDRWRERRRKYYQLRRDGKTDEADAVIAASEDLQNQWQAAKDRFDLAIQERKTLREKAAVLEKKIQNDIEALGDLVGVDSSVSPESSPADQPAPSAVERLVPTDAPATAVPTAPSPPSASERQGPVESPAPPSFAPLARTAVEPPASDSTHKHDTIEADRRLARAKKEADIRLADAREAEHLAESVSERIEGLRNNVAIEQQLLDIAHAKADQAQAVRASLDKEVQRKLVEDPAGLDAVWQKIAAADERYAQAREEARGIEDRLADLRREVGRLQDDQIAALGKAKQTHDAADAAQGILDRLQNPFTPTNVIQWFLDHGPKLLTILAVTLVLSLLVKLSCRQIAQVVARTGSRGTARDRQNRALTLVGVFRNTASLVLITGGLIMALDEVGIPIGPLMGGAAVLGLAVAFGAQNLIRDYFSGFMVLLEDQYGIGDVVKIGEVSGSVEKITLRVTVLRDMEGAVHFIPHGSITLVTNMTHGWSRAVVDIGVAYKEDPDRVMDVLLNVAKEMRRDPTYGPLILDGPEMLGVESLGDSSVVIRFFLKTQPLQRWFVRRELLRRVKRTFDEVGIEIPFPQRTIHHRYDGNGDEAHAIVGRRLRDGDSGD